MNHADTSIVASLLKRSSSARAPRPNSKESRGSRTHVPHTSVESNDPVETQTSAALDDYRMISNPALKNAKENIPSSDSEVPSIGVFPSSSVQFGMRLNHSQTTTTEANVVTMSPLSLESNIPGSSSMFTNFSSTKPPSDPNPPMSAVNVIPSSGKEALIPTLASLAALLPQFQHPFTTTDVPRTLDWQMLLMKKLLTTLGPTSWRGIPSFVCTLLNSMDFGDVNDVVQIAAIQLVLHQACADMKEKHVNAFEGKTFLYSYPGTEHQGLDHFSSMVSQKYSLFKHLEGDSVDMNILKEKLGALEPSLNPGGTSSNV
ncbi:unnamed protein product [Lactuca saligna]|uniref:Uncharacterized protein n=1 Tax=Lactuca saligna TaxID=75948 RepID=A0AA35Y1R7_LACSI|nr:unnamed protein product [Lactuca saligna]